MNKNISNKILEYYSNLFEQYGYNPKSVGWGSRSGKQSLRFEILCQIGNIRNSTILDVGCGFGDLYGYLKLRKIKTKYFGIDINPKLIELGKKIYPKASLKFRDIEKNPFQKKFDWVLASGITSHGSTYSHLTGVMKEMFRICRKGFSMNFVSDNVDYKTKSLFYSSPKKILSILKPLSNRIVLRHDYMPYEFTIFVYKNNLKTSNNVFKDFIKNSEIKFDDRLWHKKFKNKN